MNAFELWIDVQCSGETVCTLFGELQFPVRPAVGERISFHQEKGSSYEFKIQASELGFSREHIVSVVVAEISHYGVKTKGEANFRASIRCSDIVVASREDAKRVCDFLKKQFRLEVARMAQTIRRSAA